MKKIHWISLLALVLLLVSGGVAWSLLREDPDLAELRDLEAQLRSAEDLPQEQREQLVQQLRDVRENLTEDQLRAYGQRRRQEFQGRMQDQMNQYFSLPRQERVAFLDAEIRRQEERRKEWEQRRKEREANGESQGNGAARGGRGGPGGPPFGGGGRGRGGPGRDSTNGMPDNERRMERRRRMLDATSPEERAQFVQFREELQERRKQLGLPDTGWGRGRR